MKGTWSKSRRSGSMNGETISKVMAGILDRFKKIHTFIFDVDGVFTDGSLLLTEQGELLRKMSTKDGLALKKMVRSEYQAIIITGGDSAGVKKRFESMGVQHYFSSTHDKIGRYESLLKEGIVKNNEGCLYLGDDLPDLPVIQRVGLGCCPQDAIPEVKRVADYISPFKGGEGCVRDVIEKVLKLHGRWP